MSATLPKLRPLNASLMLPESSELVLQRALAVALASLSSLWTVAMIVDSLMSPGGATGVPVTFAFVYGGIVTLILWASSAMQVIAGRLRRGVDRSIHLVEGVVTAEYDRATLLLLTARRLTLATVVATPLALLILIVLTAQDGAPEHHLILSRWIIIAAGITGSLALMLFTRERWAWVFLGSIVVLVMLKYVLATDLTLTDAIFTMSRVTVGVGFMVAAAQYLRSLAQSIDRALLDSASSLARASTEAAEVTEAARIDGLVHDHILAALLLASRATNREDAPFVRRSAASALAALSEITSPRSPDGSPTTPLSTVSVTEFASDLIAQVRNTDPTIRCAGRGSNTGTIPEKVADSLSGAVMEAVRNSIRHADPQHTGVRRTVRIESTSRQLRIVVEDDGVGFDPRTAGEGRYGLSGSILGRISHLPGGGVDVRTAPGKGTAITVTWKEPEAADRPADAEAGSRTTTPPGAASHNPLVREFTQISANVAQEIALGPLIRGMLVVVLASLTMALISFDSFDPWWLNLAAIVTMLAWAVYLLLLWSTHRLADPPRRTAIGFALTGPLVLVMTLLGWSEPVRGDLNLWSVCVALLIAANLALSNFPVLAWFSSLSSGTVLLVWGLTQNGQLIPAFFIWPLFVFLPLAANWSQHAALRSITSAAEVSASYRSVITERSQEISAANERRTRGLRVDTLARPLLERLAAGEHTELPVRIEALQLEAHLRDDLRARCFRDTDVTRAANEARRAGVRVELLDDGGLADVSERTRQEVIDLSAQALDAADNGSVTIRVAPPGREIVATIVTRPDQGQPARLEIYADLLPPDSGAPDSSAAETQAALS